MNIFSFFRTLNYVINQPLTKDDRLKAVYRFIKWQILGHLSTDKIVYEWINGAKFYFSPSQWGISGNIYTGLLEFEDMAFLLHTLRKNELFVDVGANYGSYSILACAVIGAKAIAFEPIPETFKNLQENIRLNQIDERIQCFNKALGEEKGDVKFSRMRVSALNHVLSDSENPENSITVDMTTLDDALHKKKPNFLKMDVEGYEYAVLQGSKKILKQPELNAIVVEINELGNNYGFTKSMIFDLLDEFGFMPIKYDPFSRTISDVEKNKSHMKNTLFVKNKDLIMERIKSAQKFKIFSNEI